MFFPKFGTNKKHQTCRSHEDLIIVFEVPTITKELVSPRRKGYRRQPSPLETPCPFLSGWESTKKSG